MTLASQQVTPSKRTTNGTILETEPNNLYLVQLERGYTIRAHIAPTMRKFSIRILPGDQVLIELSPFDVSRGKIVKRLN